jgi:hypothetical protein
MEPSGASQRSTDSAVPIEHCGISRYSKHADEFVRQVLTVCTPAGGEMSGLRAHFLFAAFSTSEGGK